MNDYNWELIAKYLAGETNDSEEQEFQDLLENDAQFRKEFEESRIAWSGITASHHDFDKERVKALCEQKIRSGKSKLKLRSLLRYAAIFIGFIVGISLLYKDINSTLTIVAKENKTEIKLPDGSMVMLNKGASIRYGNSLILGFNRELALDGRAYFEITKSPEGKHFVVKTNDYNIEVFGTKFDVETNIKESRVVLVEGKIQLNNFKNSKIGRANLTPGQVAYIEHDGQQLSVRNVNPRLYTTWTQDRLHFDNFSISELGKIFKLQYHKTLVVNENINLDNRVGGSAPTDDLQLILDGLKIVLKREIIQRNDTIFIK